MAIMTLTVLLLVLRHLLSGNRLSRRSSVLSGSDSPAAGTADPPTGTADPATDTLNKPERHAWFTSRHEAQWHACPANTALRHSELRALCGHLARHGPYRGRASPAPPEHDEDDRSVCDACLHTIGHLPPHLPRTLPLWSTHGDIGQDRPTHDPDKLSGTTSTSTRSPHDGPRHTPLAA
ncbi:hypothetical protein IL38_17880 [Actinopolyspora erythraea]|uniref:Secreted protein n=2 Tax=Actinopolyspora erythraea TaxID=414996 RepID=A0ABR4X1I5_9ACTN|nr:hypothetical protein [Actinopolyspora erythraea]KGI80328.1 hypothetical protein IL38_17880 [Actinopolyspora erythraea]